MERLRELLVQIRTNLAALNLSQRLVVALCAALIATSLLWLLNWSTDPHMVPALDQEFSFSELGDAETALSLQSIGFETRGRKIYVHQRDQNRAIRVLHENDAVPDDGRIDLDTLIKMDNPFQPEAQRRWSQNVAKQNKIAQIMMTSPLVKDAEVIINPQTKIRIGAPNNLPTAMVTVTLADGKSPTPEQVDGFASMVGRAVSGLETHNIAVVDGRTMRSYQVPHPDDAIAAGYLDEVKKREDHLHKKVLDTLSYIPSVLVSVSIELDNARTRVEQQTHGDPTLRSESTSEERMTSPEVSTEPGVNPNIGVALTASSGGGTSSTEQREKEFYPANLREVRTTEQVAMAIKRVTAAVKIPRSWIVSVYQLRFPDQESPTDDDLKDAIASERLKVTQSVAKTLITDPGDVQVDVYPDFNVAGESMIPGRAGAGAAEPERDAMALARDYGPQVGLGMLALLSLWMMLRVARKSSELVKSAATDMPPPPDESLVALMDPVAGTAEVSEGFMEAHEVDDATLRRRQLSREVVEMIERDPDTAAGMIEKWVEETN